MIPWRSEASKRFRIMDFFKCLKERASCRAFLDKSVEPSIIDRILLAANRNPSFMNSQPWNVFVVAGENKEALAHRLYEQATNRVENAPDLSFPEEWPKSIEWRIRENQLNKFAFEGIDPENETLIQL